MFLKHANNDVRDNVRDLMQPYPHTEDLQQKLQTHVDWTNYKQRTLKKLYNNFDKKKLVNSQFQIRV